MDGPYLQIEKKILGFRNLQEKLEKTFTRICYSEINKDKICKHMLQIFPRVFPCNTIKTFGYTLLICYLNDFNSIVHDFSQL